MADLEAFLTGYLTSRTAKMQRDQDKAEKERSRLEALSMRNEVIGRNRTAAYDSAQNMANQLMSWGATPEMIQASVKSGVKNLPEFYNTVKDIHSTLGTEGTKKYFDQEGDYIQTDLGGATPVTAEGIPELLRATYGLPSGTVVGDYKAPEQSLLGKLFGKSNARERMIAELDAQQSAVGGYSVYDLTTLSALPDYLPGSQGESIVYKQPTIYTSQNFSDEIETLKRNFDDLPTVNDAYKAAKDDVATALDTVNVYKTDIQKIQNDTSLSDADRQTRIDAITSSAAYQNAVATYDRAQGELDKIGNNVMGYLVEKQASQYFNASKYYEDVNDYVKRMYGVNLFSPEQIQEQKDIEDFVANSQAGGLTGTTPSGTTPTETTRTVTTPQGAEIEITTVDGVEKVKAKDGTLLSDDESNAILDALYEEQPFDMPEAFVEGYNIPEKTIEERVAEKRESVGNVRQQIVEGYVAADEALGQTFAELDRSVASGMLTANEKMNTLFGAAAQMVGADDTADFFYKAAINSEDKAEDIEGLIPAINNLLDAWGVPDLTRDTPPAVALDSAMESLSTVMADATNVTLDALTKRSNWTPDSWPTDDGGRNITDDNVLFDMMQYDMQEQGGIQEPSYYTSDGFTEDQVKRVSQEIQNTTAAAARAPAHVEKLGEQAMDAWRKLTAEVKDFKMSDVDVDFVTADEDNPMLKLITTLVGEETPKEKVVEYANVFTRATDTPASKQLQQLIVDQLDIADNEAKKIVVESKKATPEAAVDSFVQRMDASQATPSQQEIADLKTMLELHQIILPSRPAYTPPEGDVAKAFRKSEANSYGARGLPQQGEILASNLDAQQDIDTPPELDADGLPELPRNMAVESMLTRRDRGPGLMRKPSDPEQGDMPSPEELDKSTALVDLRSVMSRVHGKKSKAVKELDKIVQQSNRGIPIQYTDVNRLLRMTKSLRKSETRDKLIEQLAILANEARK